MGSLDLLDGWGQTIREVRAYQLRQQQIRARVDSISDSDAARMRTTMQAFPRVPLSFHEALAKERLPLDSPTTRQIIDSIYQRNAAVLTPGKMDPGYAASTANWHNSGAEWGDEARQPYRPPRGDINRTPRSNRKEDYIRHLPPGIRRIVYNDPVWQSKPDNPDEYVYRVNGIIDGAGVLHRPGRATERKIGSPSRPLTPHDERREKLFFDLVSMIHDQTGAEEIPYMDAQYGLSMIRPKVAQEELANNFQVPLRHNYSQAINVGRYPVEEGVHKAGIINTGIEMLGQVKLPSVRTPGLPDQLQTAGPGQESPNLKTLARTGLMTLDAAGWQGPQALFRDVVTGHRPSLDSIGEQTDLGVFLRSGDPSSAGSGWLINPESEVAQTRHKNELERGDIGGHTITPGRYFANFITDPDTVPFDLVSGSIDFAAQVLDPVAIGMGGVSKVSAARQLFEPREMAGLFQGIRKQFYGPAWETWKNTAAGINVRETLLNKVNTAKEARQLWNVVPDWNPEWVERFRASTTLDDVDQVFDDLVGPSIRTPKELENVHTILGDEPLLQNLLGQTRKATASIHNTRAAAMLPAHELDALDKRHAAEHLQRWMRLGKADDDAMDEAFLRVAQAESKNGIEQAVEYAMEHERGILAKAGVGTPQSRRQFTRLFRESREDALAAVFNDVASDHPIRLELLARGERVQDLSPQLTAEYLQRYVPLPDIRNIQRMVADPKYRWLVTPLKPSQIGRQRFPQAALDFFMTDLWKPAMLLGRFPAWLTRVLGEEQGRIMASGLDGINHPISYMAMALGITTKGPPSGGPWDAIRQFELSSARLHGGRIRRPGATRATPTLINKLDANHTDDFLHAWADQIGSLNFSPTIQTLLSSGSENTLTWMKSTKLGRKELLLFREAEPGKFDTDAQILHYLEHDLGERVHILTNDNAELIDAAKTGIFRGEQIFKKGGTKLNPKFKESLNDVLDDAPRLVKGFDQPHLSKYGPIDIYKRAVDMGFANTMSRASDFASIGPTWKQYFYKEVARLLPWSDAATINKVLAGAKEQNVGRRLMKQLEKRAKQYRPDSNIKIHSIDELEFLAAGYAMDQKKRLLYDLSERGNLAESLTLLAPFANAYQEMLTTWPKILWGKQYGIGGKMAKTLQVSRRVQQTVEGARRNGWIMKNSYGEDVFVMPFSEWYTKQLSGVPVPLTGSVSGLNMVTTSVFPGIGPALSVPVAAMLEGKPGKWQDVYDTLLPYGAPGERNPDDITSWLSYMPAWMQKMVMTISAGPPPGLESIPGVSGIWKAFRPSSDQVMWDNNAFMNTQKDVLRYKLMSGDYDMSKPGAMNAALEDSFKATKNLYYIRAAMQFFAPTAPSFNFVFNDKSGTSTAFAAVSEEFYSMLDDGKSMDEATYELIDKYGTDVLELLVPKTKASVFAVPRTKEAGNWVKSNPDIRNNFPATYGLFAPQGGQYDHSVLVDQYVTNQVDNLTPRQWLNLRNDMLKNLQYYYYRDQVGEDPTDEEQAWLDRIRAELEEAYPSYTGNISRFDDEARSQAIRELYRAVEDPKLADTEMAQGLKAYLYYRDQAQAYAEESGFKTWQQPDGLYGTRQWLSGVAQEIIKDYPDFRLAWSTLLSREVERELR